jgi:hypothetical protein
MPILAARSRRSFSGTACYFGTPNPKPRTPETNRNKISKQDHSSICWSILVCLRQRMPSLQNRNKKSQELNNQTAMTRNCHNRKTPTPQILIRSESDLKLTLILLCQHRDRCSTCKKESTKFRLSFENLYTADGSPGTSIPVPKSTTP